MGAVSFTLNGKPVRVEGDENRPLLWVLRDDLGLTGTKYGCGASVCGACTVVVEKSAVRACVTPLRAVADKSVTTIEGLAKGEDLHPVQEAFVKHLGFQCGFCTPGMVMGVYAVLLTKPDATRADFVRKLDGHICRCAAYGRILDAAQSAAAAGKGGAK